MGLFIPDEILTQAGLSDRDALIEFACRLFDAGKLDKPTAERMCGLSRVEFEAQLHARGLTVYRTTAEDYHQDRDSFPNPPVRKAG